MDISQFNLALIKSFKKEVDKKKLHELHNNLPFLTKKMEVEKPVTNWHDNTEYIFT